MPQSIREWGVCASVQEEQKAEQEAEQQGSGPEEEVDYSLDEGPAGGAGEEAQQARKAALMEELMREVGEERARRGLDGEVPEMVRSKLEALIGESGATDLGELASRGGQEFTDLWVQATTEQNESRHGTLGVPSGMPSI